MLAGGLFRVQAEEAAGRLIDEIDHAVRIEQDHAFLQRLEDFFEKPFLADQAGDDLLDLSVFHTIQPGDEFFEKSGFHREVAGFRFLVFREGMKKILLVICTFPDAAVARQIGTALVEKQLAACVNLIPGMESVYRWQGKVESAAEVMAVFKTSAAVFPEFERELAAMHPYEVPEIVAIEPAAVAETYAEWVVENLRVS